MILSGRATLTRFFGMIWRFGREATRDSNCGLDLLLVGEVSVDLWPPLSPAKNHKSSSERNK